MFYIGLTGNIASGKTTVAANFAKLGIDVISADHIARELTQSTTQEFHKIVKHFGYSILNTEGELDRRMLRKIIFTNIQERNWLEDLMHPIIRKKIKQQLTACKSSYCIIEIPLLYDKSLYPYLNRVLYVQAKQKQQLSRLMDRDKCILAEALAILATQADIEHHLSIADDILFNTGTVEQLQEQVATLHRQYMRYALKH